MLRWRTKNWWEKTIRMTRARGARALVRLVFFFAAATDGWRSCDVLWEGAAKKRAHLVTDGSGAEAMQRILQARKKEGKALRAGQRDAGGDECGGAA